MNHGKFRIVERILPDKSKIYVIQQKHVLFWWVWVDASLNTAFEIQDEFDSLEEARKNICFFDGTKTKERVVEEL